MGFTVKNKEILHSDLRLLEGLYTYSYAQQVQCVNFDCFRVMKCKLGTEHELIRRLANVTE